MTMTGLSHSLGRSSGILIWVHTVCGQKVFSSCTLVNVCPISTACKNIVDHFHQIFMSVARIRFDSHVSHWKEAYKNSLVLSAF